MQCPHCLIAFHESWTLVPLIGDVDNTALWLIRHTICPACKRLIVQFGQAHVFPGPANNLNISCHETTFRFVRPIAISRPRLPAEVPTDFSTDYYEAVAVLADSQKASAALSRRCLQYLLREKAATKRRGLAEQIQEVLDSGRLPSHLADNLDAIRNVGNYAAHPSKSTNTGEIVDVEPHEAEWLIEVLEGLFDFYFVQPAKSKARRDALDAKLSSIGKPPMKTP
jgi:Domain of unknown function (DUF4145)